MDAEEREICDFLKSWPGQFVAVREICRRAGGKWRYREDPNWALPVLARLLEQGVIESDTAAHYRLRALEKRGKSRRWVAPHIKKILEESGKEIDAEASAETSGPVEKPEDNAKPPE